MTKKIWCIGILSASVILQCAEPKSPRNQGAVIVMGKVFSGKSTLIEHIKRVMSKELPMPFVISTDQYIKDFAQVKRADYLKMLIRDVKSKIDDSLKIAERRALNVQLNLLQEELDAMKDHSELERQLRQAQNQAKLWSDEEAYESFWIPYNTRIQNALEQSKWVVCEVCYNAEPVRKDLLNKIIPYLSTIVLVRLDASKKTATHRFVRKFKPVFAEIDKLYLKGQSQECISTVQSTMTLHSTGQKHDIETQYENKDFFSLTQFDSQKGIICKYPFDIAFDTSNYPLDLGGESSEECSHSSDSYEAAAKKVIEILKKKSGY